jgi:hypothetical protein
MSVFQLVTSNNKIAHPRPPLSKWLLFVYLPKAQLGCTEIVRFMIGDGLAFFRNPLQTYAHGSVATIAERDAENREVVRSQSRLSLRSADEQTEDAPHEERRERSASPTIPRSGIFYHRCRLVVRLTYAREQMEHSSIHLDCGAHFSRRGFVRVRRRSG